MKIYFKFEIKQRDLFWEISEKIHKELHDNIMRQIYSYLKIK
jgi:hypothetical protein